MKILHSIVTNKEVKREENGQEVKELIPVYFAVKKPSRFEKEEAELIRAEYLSKFIRRGVMPEAVLSKTYSDQGGTMDEFEKTNLLNLNIQLYEGTAEFQRLSAAPDKDQSLIDTELRKIITVKDQITTLQQRQSAYYENTAEFKAKTKLIEYLFTTLTVWREKETDEWKSYFSGDTFDNKLDLIEELEEKNDEIYMKVKNKLIFIISLFVHMGGNVAPEDVKRSVEENFE